MKVNDFKISEHFKLYEFQCKDKTKAVKVVPELVEALERLRSLTSQKLNKDTPLVITSGYRTPDHNKKVGGAKNSQHLRGTAVDVRLPQGLTEEEFAKLGEKAGFTGIGLYNGRVHFDVRQVPVLFDKR